MTANQGPIDQYIAAFPPDVREILQTIRGRIARLVPEATEKIKYQLPTVVWHRNILHYGAFKNHIGLYPSPTAIEAFRQELAEYIVPSGTKATIRFPLDRPIPFELIDRIVQFRVSEIRAVMASEGRTSDQ